MTEHVRYMHVERFGTPEVDGIQDGVGVVFPKLDGTNASVWATMVGSHAEIHAGSRGRLLTPEADNHGFHAAVRGDELGPKLESLFLDFPRIRLFGEWLVPHTFKAYREEAWRRFWIFDVWGEDTQRWVPYEEYAPILSKAGLDVVHPLAITRNATLETLTRIAEGNTFLVADGAGPGEGIVLKRYDFTNRYGRTVWAKVVRNEFKEKHTLAMGVPEKGGEFQVEIAIAEETVTATLVGKERAKIECALIDEGSGEVRGDTVFCHRGKLIPRLLETVYHCVVTEELWPAIKRHKDPTIDFKKLRRHVIAQTKSLAKDLF